MSREVIDIHCTYGNWVVDDNPQAALELNRLQLLRVSRLRRNGTHLHTTMHASSKEKKNHSAQGNTTTYLSPFKRVDQTTFANVREANEADGDPWIL